jgi:hypothetical protein
MVNTVKKVVVCCKNYIMKQLQFTNTIDPLEDDHLLSSQELKLGKDLDKSNKLYKVSEFNKWVYHYNIELYNMYNQFIHDNEKIDYATFVKIAYHCTDTSFCKKMHKNIKPLI